MTTKVLNGAFSQMVPKNVLVYPIHQGTIKGFNRIPGMRRRIFGYTIQVLDIKTLHLISIASGIRIYCTACSVVLTE